MLKIENLPKMLLHLKHMSENFTQVSENNHSRQFILDNTAGYSKTHPIFTISFQLVPKPQTWLYLDRYQPIQSNQKHFNIK